MAVPVLVGYAKPCHEFVVYGQYKFLSGRKHEAKMEVDDWFSSRFIVLFVCGCLISDTAANKWQGSGELGGLQRWHIVLCQGKRHRFES